MELIRNRILTRDEQAEINGQVKEYRDKKQKANVSKATRAEIFKRDGYKCLRCNSVNNLTIDHIIAVANGGSKQISNLQTLCGDCNVWKGTKTLDYRNI